MEDAADQQGGLLSNNVFESGIDLPNQSADPGCFVRGDVNGDGLLNILDIVIIANIILGSAEYVPQADVNQDTELNILDIVILANMILDEDDI